MGVWGSGEPQKWSNLAGLENRHEEGSVAMRFRGAVSVAMEAVWDARRQLFKHIEAFLGHAEATRAPPLHEKMHAPVAPCF